MRAVCVALILGAVLLVWGGFQSTAKAELVKRTMYTDSKGKAVKAYVFQPGRSSRYARPRTYGYRYGYAPYAYGYSSYYPAYGRGLYYGPGYRGHHYYGRGYGHGHVSAAFSIGSVRVRIRY